MSKKILVVEDEILVLKTLESKLKEKGFDVVTAINGVVALEKIQNEPIDLILVDVEMPQMNGYTFVTKLKELKLARFVPVVVMAETEELCDIFRRKGVKDFCAKPPAWEELFSIVHRLTD